MKKYLLLVIPIIIFVFNGCSGSSQPKKPPFKYTIVKDKSEVIIFKRNNLNTVVSSIFTKKDFQEKSQRERLHSVFIELNKYFKSQNINNFYINTPQRIINMKKKAGMKTKVIPFMLTNVDDILDYCYPQEAGLEKDKCFIGDQTMVINITPSKQDFYRPTFSVNEKLSSSIETKLVIPKTEKEFGEKVYFRRVDR